MERHHTTAWFLECLLYVVLIPLAIVFEAKEAATIKEAVTRWFQYWPDWSEYYEDKLN